jgi:hypothetical protein
MTLKFIQSFSEEVAMLAIEIWSTLCQCEEERMIKGIPFNSMVNSYSE